MSKEIEHRQAIVDLTYTYAWAVDAKEWNLLQHVLADPIEVGMGPVEGEYRGYSREEWVSWLQRGVAGLAATQHTMTNHVVDLKSDHGAICRNYTDVLHTLGGESPSDTWRARGWYEWRLRNEDGIWRAYRYSLRLTWQHGDRDHVRKVARERTNRE